MKPGPVVERKEFEGGWLWALPPAPYRYAHRFALKDNVLRTRCGMIAPRFAPADGPLPVLHAGDYPHCSHCEAFP